jgi:glycosyltransferase involved in cell wall biosynthesis
MRRELNIFPDAFNSKEVEIDFSPQRLTRKQEELRLADFVLCPSTFVQSTVEASGFPSSRIHTIPLGVDSRWKPVHNVSREKVVLYVGNISVRKGIHRLLKIWKELKAFRTHTLRLIGDMQLPTHLLAEYKGLYEHIPRLPREDLIAQYSSAQLFVFNAMADGFGHVFAEAMVCGTPVIASRNSGAPDLITSGVDGHLFDYGDDRQLGFLIEGALSNSNKLKIMGERARKRVLQWGWEQFSQDWLSWIRSVLANAAE